MPCEPLQTKIAARESLTSEELRHVETCPDCAAFATFDAQLEARLPQWRSPSSAPALRPFPARSGKPRLAFAGLGLAAALTIAVLAVPTRSTAESAYRQMIAATRKVRTVHMVVRWKPSPSVIGETRGTPNMPVEADGLAEITEVWWQPGSWREARAGAAPTLKRIESDGLRFYRFDPASGTVRAYQERTAPDDYSNFDLPKFADQFMDKPARFERPSATQIVALNAGGWSRMVFTLDQATGLPNHAEKQYLDKGWVTSGVIDLEFDQPLDPKLFTPQSLQE